MFNKDWCFMAQEEEGAQQSSGGGDGAESSGESLIGEQEVALGEGEFFLSEGIKGSGDKPEWYDSERFKSVDQQAKSYLELEKKFGGFTGAPKDGYQLPEDLDPEDELLKTYTELATSSNMNQETFDKGFELLKTQMGVNEEISQEAEIAKLGENADKRIDAVEGFLRNNADADAYSSVKDMMTTADSIMLAEKMINIMAPAKLPIDGGEHPTGLSWSDIEKEMYKKDENGRFLRSSSPEHNKKVEKMMEEYGGTKASVVVSG